MRYHIDDLRNGYDVECDALVIGSGPGGAMAAYNLALSGMKTILLEAGKEVRPEDMTRDAPKFLARYFWEGGMRLLRGANPIPSMQGRALGGSSIMNSAIMYPLPRYVREEWAKDTNISFFLDKGLDRSYERIFRLMSVTKTPDSAMGKRNNMARKALEAVGIYGEPLPRAVKNCDGCGDCLTGCAGGNKQSVDRALLPAAERHGLEIYTCSVVKKVLTKGRRVVGAEGWVVDPFSFEKSAKFRVRAKKIVIMSAGTGHTPGILQKSGIRAGGNIGSTFYCHLAAGVTGIMEEPTWPWIGASQGWGAMPAHMPGYKYESLWAPSSVMTVKYGGFGHTFLRKLDDIKYATIIALVFRGKVFGKVGSDIAGPYMKVSIPKKEAQKVAVGVKLACEGLLKIGARYVNSSLNGAVDEITRVDQTDVFLSDKITGTDLGMTANHIFGSCRMSNVPGDGAVDHTGRVYGTENLYICDGSIFPSPSGVNPQATIMALSDMISRRLGDYQDHGLY